MKQKQKRTRIIGALIFAALVAIIGLVLVATGTFRSPFDFLQGGRPGGPGTSGFQASGNYAGRGYGDHNFQSANNYAGRGQGFTSDHAGQGGGPDAGDNGGIAWNQIGSVFSDLWILFAIIACYILVQQVLGLIINRFWARPAPHV
jgi:hypothetical protein